MAGKTYRQWRKISNNSVAGRRRRTERFGTLSLAGRGRRTERLSTLSLAGRGRRTEPFGMLSLTNKQFVAGRGRSLIILVPRFSLNFFNHLKFLYSYISLFSFNRLSFTAAMKPQKRSSRKAGDMQEGSKQSWTKGKLRLRRLASWGCWRIKM